MLIVIRGRKKLVLKKYRIFKLKRNSFYLSPIIWPRPFSFIIWLATICRQRNCRRLFRHLKIKVEEQHRLEVTRASFEGVIYSIRSIPRSIYSIVTLLYSTMINHYHLQRVLPYSIKMFRILHLYNLMNTI